MKRDQPEQNDLARILLVEHNHFYMGVLYNFLTKLGARVCTAQDFPTAIEHLEGNELDLAIIDVTRGVSDFGLKLVWEVQAKHPHATIVLLADGSIDPYLEEMASLKVGILFSKPVKKDEFSQLIRKLIHKKDLFGLENHLFNLESRHQFSVRSSDEISEVISSLLATAQQDGFPFVEPQIINLVLQETLINAVYHSHGFTTEKLERKPITLPEGYQVDVVCGKDQNRYGIAITDYKGTLTQEKVIKTMAHVVQQNQMVLDSLESGADITDFVRDHGRGLDLIRRFSGEYTYIIEKKVRTDAILIFDAVYEKDANYSSIKVIEV